MFDPIVLKGTFGIFATALILTLFEIGFFYTVMVPGIENNFHKSAQKLAKEINFNVNDDTANKIKDFGEFAEQVEQRKIEQNNSIVKRNCILIIFGIIIALFFIKNKISTVDSIINTIGETNLKISMLTVSILILFQIYFYYNIGKVFSYPNDTELLYIIQDHANS